MVNNVLCCALYLADEPKLVLNISNTVCSLAKDIQRKQKREVLALKGPTDLFYIIPSKCLQWMELIYTVQGTIKSLLLLSSVLVWSMPIIHLLSPTCHELHDRPAQKTSNLAQRSFKVTPFATNRQIVCDFTQTILLIVTFACFMNSTVQLLAASPQICSLLLSHLLRHNNTGKHIQLLLWRVHQNFDQVFC